MNYKIIFPILAFVLFFSIGCENETPPLPDNLVEFEATQVGFDSQDSAKTINIQFSRAADAASEIVIGVNATGFESPNMFATSPDIANGKITIAVTPGQTNASITVSKGNDIFLTGAELIVFTILQPGNALVVGLRDTLELHFSSIVSQGSTMTLQGGPGEASAINSVFVNFRRNVQTQVRRDSWDLAFYNGDEFRAILNYASVATARGIDKFDLLQVGAQDTIGMSLAISTADPTTVALFDDVSGDINKTVFGNISAIASENRVFIVNRGTGGGIPARAWKKIRILQNGNGYTLQHANITDNTFQSINISKDDDYNFIFFCFDRGIVQVEPKKQNWDIVWTGGINVTTAAGGVVPHYFADQVFINHHGNVSVAQVMTANIAWADINATHLATLQFSPDRNIIGTSWRSARGTIGVFADRFYVVKDAFGNYYKLRFLNFHSNDGGVRGFPNIEYQLIQKGGAS